MRARLAVTETGTGEPLVLIHGIATDRHIWDLVVPTLADSRRVVTLDLPGFGESQPAGQGFDLELVAKRIARGLAARGLRGPVDLVGHSLWRWCRDHPGGGLLRHLIRRLFLVAPAGLRPFPAPVSKLLATSADAALAARRKAVSLTDVAWGRRLLLMMTAADGAGMPPTLARQMVEASSTARRTEAALATITSTDLRPLVARIAAPLGVIWGEADRTVPIRALEDLLAARPDAAVVRLPEAGHVPMVERPAEFVAALRALSSELPVALLRSDTTPSGVSTTVP